ncbi:MAG: hypothetical protein KDA45_02250 [Planctomycetales bacterium]|nr:hypothetical protein [Planctomycetales bacterium]
MQILSRLFSLAIVVAVLSIATRTASAQEYYGSGPQLFANQYTQGAMNQATAKMYVAPVPVPEWVGHTYYTYQPLYPHEMLYAHTHRYHSYYDNGQGLNSTRVHYAPSIKGRLHGMFDSIIPRP